eukprot:gnl/TRDRNA2_/TRDRNA2_176082_c15_seq1.p2 gnl/TRDRNA2_/TRDRNA2_176082_c15~~gnl/TRDRNA2_/TRDRNA2_176082_c15_seq1.p2  ORF type:complete len:109 (+),score=20.58 gnl/TRDRNA2_/TRDRNA2_176082_c15_seq1:164-490(+)
MALALAAEQPTWPQFNAQGIANMAWALATLAQHDKKCFGALAGSAARRVEQLTVQGLANTVWAFATTRLSAEAKLFAALTPVAERRMAEVNVQDLANMLWAFVVAGTN